MRGLSCRLLFKDRLGQPRPVDCAVIFFELWNCGFPLNLKQYGLFSCEFLPIRMLKEKHPDNRTVVDRAGYRGIPASSVGNDRWRTHVG